MEYYQTKIRELRKKHKESQKEIAELLETKQTIYSRYERGEDKLPIKHLITLCKHWNVSADYILGLREEE